MKMNARDKMILLGLACVVIVIAGIFGLIRPKMKTIDEDKKSLADVKAKWEQIDAKIQEIGPLQDKITDSYDDSKKLSDDFIKEEQFFDENGDFMTYKLDQFMQPYIDKCNLEAVRVELGTHGTATLGYYYFEPDVVITSMFDAADVNGKYREDLDKRMEESNSLAERNQEEIIQTQFGFTARGTKENIWKFMEEIDNMNTSVIIDSVTIEDYTFGEDAEPGPDKDDKSNVTFVISFYSVFDMDEPIVEE